MADFDDSPKLYPNEPDPPSNEALALELEHARLRRQIAAAIRLGCTDQMRLVRKFASQTDPFRTKDYVMTVVQEVMNELVDAFRNHDVYRDAFEFVQQNKVLIELLSDEVLVIDQDGQPQLNLRVPTKEIPGYVKTITDLWQTRFGFLEKMGISVAPHDPNEVSSKGEIVDSELKQLEQFEAEEAELNAG